MKLEIIKKAFEVKDPSVEWERDSPDENWEIIYAKTPGEAKMCCSESNGFLSTKARRAKHNDIVLYNGIERRRGSVEWEVSENKRKKERADKILSFPETEMFYIQNGYVGNSVLWWALEGRGYTTKIRNAQKYTREEVLNKFRKEDMIWAASHVENHITEVVDGQYLEYKFVC